MIDNNLITLARLSGYVYSSMVLFGLIKERGEYIWLAEDLTVTEQ